ncbi:ATP-binding protein [Celeribacter neptunius]|uniref:histidine kinase n=1 Tax=Celeribacter neptunius TaxID=588602 RepID=A0A1I3UFG7_9RHOB|nr:ATP-binding protein [Celeribacter neptunius]SFJ80551.1 two-component system, OmpR family, sensor kinase [Celeribacter neptunius]
MSLLSRPRSLRLRIALFTGTLVTVFWLVAAAVTTGLLFDVANKVFDRDLRATAERILPIVIHERFRERDDEPRTERSHELEQMRRHEDDVEFIVTSEKSGLLLQSRGAGDIAFPESDGFSSDGTWRFYVTEGERGDFTIAVARPLSARRDLALAAMAALSLPLLIVIPLMLFGIFLLVKKVLRPVGQLERDMGARGPTNLSPIPSEGMPSELLPVVDSGNRLLERIADGFEAERSFAANAAHEMRTPLAGAIAQAQRLRAESGDPTAVARAGEIEASLKRLSRYGEKLMQLARAEGARLRLDAPTDLRPVVEIVLEDFIRAHGAEHFTLDLPKMPVMSNLDPDAFGIVLRNLVENALTHGAHGAPDRPVEIRLSADCLLSVRNDGEAIPAETLERLGRRFMRGDGAGNGTGLGLSIIHIIAERSNATFTLLSPRSGHETGVEGQFRF